MNISNFAITAEEMDAATSILYASSRNASDDDLKMIDEMYDWIDEKQDETSFESEILRMNNPPDESTGCFILESGNNMIYDWKNSVYVPMECNNHEHSWPFESFPPQLGVSSCSIDYVGPLVPVTDWSIENEIKIKPIEDNFEDNFEERDFKDCENTFWDNLDVKEVTDDNEDDDDDDDISFVIDTLGKMIESINIEPVKKSVDLNWDDETETPSVEPVKEPVKEPEIKQDNRKETSIPITFVKENHMGDVCFYLATFNDGQICYIPKYLSKGPDLILGQHVGVIASPNVGEKYPWRAFSLRLTHKSIDLRMEISKSITFGDNKWGLFIGRGGCILRETILYAIEDTSIELPRMNLEVESSLIAYCNISGLNIDKISIDKIKEKFQNIGEDNCFEVVITQQ